MPPKKKEEPVGTAIEVLAPVTLLIVILVILAWGITKINEAIPVEIWSFGAGAIIAGLGILVILWQKYT